MGATERMAVGGGMRKRDSERGRAGGSMVLEVHDMAPRRAHDDVLPTHAVIGALSMAALGVG